MALKFRLYGGRKMRYLIFVGLYYYYSYSGTASKPITGIGLATCLQYVERAPIIAIVYRSAPPKTYWHALCNTPKYFHLTSIIKKYFFLFLIIVKFNWLSHTFILIL